MTSAELKEARHTLGLSSRQMAEALTDPDHLTERPAINARTIRRWEAGVASEIPHPVVVAVKLLLKRRRK